MKIIFKIAMQDIGNVIRTLVGIKIFRSASDTLYANALNLQVTLMKNKGNKKKKKAWFSKVENLDLTQTKHSTLNYAKKNEVVKVCHFCKNNFVIGFGSCSTRNYCSYDLGSLALHVGEQVLHNTRGSHLSGILRISCEITSVYCC